MTSRPDTLRQHPLHDTDATRRIERAATARLPPHALMDRAGRAVARLAMALAPHARHVWIACGPGNNGGDGFEAASLLRAAGRSVSVGFAGDADRLPPDARRAFDRARDAGVPLAALPPADASPQDLFIDALLGIGVAAGAGGRAPPVRMAAMLAALHAAPCPVLSVDVPSGLDADHGCYATGFAPPDGAPPPPRHTLALLTLKPGLFTGHGRDAAGTVWLDDLQAGDALSDPPAPCAWLSAAPRIAHRAHAAHKGSFGDVAILGGEGLALRGMGMGGAALLAGSAALHAGAGRVLVALVGRSAGGEVDMSQPELMMRSPEVLEPGRGVVVCGCGGGQAVAPWVPRMLAGAGRLVLDADALNLIAGNPDWQRSLAGRAGRGQPTVITPHPLEAARLLATDTAGVQADRLAAARTLAERFRCVVVLKGSGSIVAAPDLIPFLNPTGNGRLGTAGTGDVLAGMVGAALAGLSPAGPPPDVGLVHGAVRDAVHAHGALADRWPASIPLTAGRLARRGPASWTGPASGQPAHAGF